jgi:peptidoglycan/xylan/chitin deacetylase (PgdA/CDA1 family)
MVSFKSSVIASWLCTLAVASPLVAKRQAVGVIINSCTVPGDFAIAFDDGPFQYTSEALDLLDAAGIKATFFMNGQNYDSIYNYAGVIQRMAGAGHQVASHT